MKPRDLTATAFTAAMSRAGFGFTRGLKPQCRDRWLNMPIPADVAPVMDGRKLRRSATLAACKCFRAAETQRRAAHEARAAKQRATAERLAPSLMTPARCALTDTAAIRLMADDMIEISATRGSCDRDDLALCGWDYSQIDEFGPRARAAAQQAQMMVAA